MHKLLFGLLQKRCSTCKDIRKKKKIKEHFLGCLVTYLLLLGNVIFPFYEQILGLSHVRKGYLDMLGIFHLDMTEKWSLTFLTW